MRIRHVLVALAATAVAAGAFALPPTEPPPPPPPPPPELNDCSPGFWKNHPELWDEGVFCFADLCVPDYMDMLRAKGKGSGETRHWAADTLNDFADSYYGYPVCTD